MKNRMLMICVALVLGVAALTAYYYAQVPATVALHWDLQGHVNGYGPRSFLFVHVALMAALIGLWLLLPALSPGQFTVDTFADTYWRIGVLVIGLLAFIHCMLLWGAVSSSAPMERILPAGVAVFIGLLGNVMGKVRRNFWIGIRTPWTLASDRVWYATHRMGARTMVGGAVLSLLASLLGLPMAVCMGLAIAGLLVPAVYSYWLYRRIEGDGAAGA